MVLSKVKVYTCLGRRPIAIGVEITKSTTQKGKERDPALASDPRPHTFAARSLARSCSLIVSFLAIPRFVPTLRAHTACLAAHCTHVACMDAAYHPALLARVPLALCSRESIDKLCSVQAQLRSARQQRNCFCRTQNNTVSTARQQPPRLHCGE